MMSARTEALLGAVAPLHDAPQDAAVWQRALGLLAATIPCGQVALVERTGAATNGELGFVAGTDARFLDEYRREFHRVDPFAREEVVAQLHDLGRVAHSSEVVRDVELQHSPFYQQFLSRHGDLFHGLGGSFALCERSHAQLWLMRPRGQGFDEDERRRLDVFFAHARSALRQRRWQARIKRERDAALAWMDGWADASFVLDANGGLVVANLVGERVLRAGNWLRLQDARVCAARGEAGDWVRTTLASMLRAPREGHADSARCVALKGEGGAALYAVFTRLPPAQASSTDDSPRFGLILRDPRQARPQPDARQLHDLFGLTAAESRIANALLAGQTVETIARDASVRRDTVRAHVKRMLSKTGTRRQSDLLKLLVKTLPNLRSLSGASEAGDAAE